MNIFDKLKLYLEEIAQGTYANGTFLERSTMSSIAEETLKDLQRRKDEVINLLVNPPIKIIEHSIIQHKENEELRYKLVTALKNALIYADYCDEFKDTSKNGDYLEKARKVLAEFSDDYKEYYELFKHVKKGV